MRKADLVLVVLAALAVWATLAGALGGDRWTDERTVRFATAQVPLGPAPPQPAGGGGAHLTWTAPANATSADFVILVTFEGQALRGGNAIVTVRAIGPDGEAQPPATQAWAIPQGATSASLELNATAAWRDVPPQMRDTTGAGHGVAWSQPITLHVAVQAPSDLPLASYAFEAGAHATATTYAAT